ncbi:hypothetical protein PHISP_02319 [Aspergillus sp. HF37]|nr:hypothetical protein PHISP_02319 [Aspergillus sp. HF37]
MNSPNTNLRGFTQAVHTLATSPSQFLPHLTIPTFTDLPERNLGHHLQYAAPPPPPSSTMKGTGTGAPTIRALAIDKDNTLSPPKTTVITPEIYAKLQRLRNSAFRAPNSILIVSNRAGSHPVYAEEVAALEGRLSELGIPVFRLPAGCEKKPFCGGEVVRWFRERGVVSSADEVAVVGDRLGTDGVMAGLMGSWSVWCTDGVAKDGERPARNILETMEAWAERFLRANCGLKPPPPRGFDA